VRGGGIALASHRSHWSAFRCIPTFHCLGFMQLQNELFEDASRLLEPLRLRSLRSHTRNSRAHGLTTSSRLHRRPTAHFPPLHFLGDSAAARNHAIRSTLVSAFDPEPSRSFPVLSLRWPTIIDIVSRNYVGAAIVKFSNGKTELRHVSLSFRTLRADLH